LEKDIPLPLGEIVSPYTVYVIDGVDVSAKIYFLPAKLNTVPALVLFSTFSSVSPEHLKLAPTSCALAERHVPIREIMIAIALARCFRTVLSQLFLY
jgi:hypothetical protein